MPSQFVTLAGYKSVIDGLQGLAEQYTTDATWVVGTNVKYSIFVELGTSRMAAQPYLRPAVQSVRGSAASILDGAESLEAGLEEIATRIKEEARRMCPVDTGTLRASISIRRV